MPLYEYECQHCHLIFESLHKMDEYLDGYPCPTCEGFGKKIITKMPLHSYSNRPNERPWGTHLRPDKKKGGEK